MTLAGKHATPVWDLVLQKVLYQTWEETYSQAADRVRGQVSVQVANQVTVQVWDEVLILIEGQFSDS